MGLLPFPTAPFSLAHPPVSLPADPWNWIDFLNLGFFWALIVMRIVFLMDPRRAAFDTTHTTYISLEQLAYTFYQEVSQGASAPEAGLTSEATSCYGRHSPRCRRAAAYLPCVFTLCLPRAPYPRACLSSGAYAGQRGLGDRCPHLPEDIQVSSHQQVCLLPSSARSPSMRRATMCCF